jgi:hypothetical protein
MISSAGIASDSAVDVPSEIGAVFDIDTGLCVNSWSSMENGESDEIIQPDDSYAAQFLLS